MNPAGRVVVLFRVGGVEIGFTPSWLLMVTFLAIIFEYWGVIPADAGRVTGALTSVALALAFYVSVLLHEGAHAIVARAFNLKPQRIVLFLLGGVSQIGKDADQPRQEYLVALAGPVISLLLGGIVAAAAHFGGNGSRTILRTLSTLNIALAGFNMIPGFPLDGGRVLRSMIWAATTDRTKATRIAARTGQIVAAGLAAGGVAYVLLNLRDVSSIAFAIWYLVLGYFLFSHASFAEREELERIAVQEEIRLKAATMKPQAGTIPLSGDIVPELPRKTRRSPRLTSQTTDATLGDVSTSKPTSRAARLDVLKKSRSDESNVKKSKTRDRP